MMFVRAHKQDKFNKIIQQKQMINLYWLELTDLDTIEAWKR